MSAKLYVVMASQGEYSDRGVWVAGVFDDRTAAENMIREKSAFAIQHKTNWSIWNNRYNAALTKDADREKVLQRFMPLQPRPQKDENFDELWLVEVEINTWGKFDEEVDSSVGFCA